MILWNYTSLRTRDSKIYSVGGHAISGGISIEFLKVTAPVAIIFIIIGALLGAIFGISFFNVFSDKFHMWWTIIWTGLGIGVGCGLWHIQFAGYRLYQYLIAYFQPKKVYMNDWRHTEFKLHNFSIKTLVRHIL